MKEKYQVRHGGLTRCCLASLDDAMVAVTEPPKEGDTASCKYGCEKDGMIFRDGAWEWSKAQETLNR